jgi:integrase
LSEGTVRHHLNALSNLYARARSEGWVTTGYDPVGDLLEKPVGDPEAPRWLEVPEAALYLAAAHHTPAGPAANGQPPVSFGYELVATFLLTGGRQDEVLGLEVSDVDLERKTVTFRPNAWRRLKTEKSHRTVPLWPQLERILRPYVAGASASRLLFPSPRNGKMLTDVRKLLDRVMAKAGTLYVMDEGRRRKAEEGEIRTKAFRHTYITARLQTLDHGQPVSLWTVAREVGHSSTGMIERVYGHLGTVRHRATAVEYRTAQHRKVLRGRLALVA